MAGLSIGKTENRVVSASSLLADERMCYPPEVEPYTPAHHFDGGKNDPEFRTKLEIARDLAGRTLGDSVECRAVVDDSLYGEDRHFKRSLEQHSAGYVRALKASRASGHKIGEVGPPWEAALATGWQDAHHPGDWMKVVRHFRDGHDEGWWAPEVDVGPYGPEGARRAIVATRAPASLLDLATW